MLTDHHAYQLSVFKNDTAFADEVASRRGFFSAINASLAMMETDLVFMWIEIPTYSIEPVPGNAWSTGSPGV